MVQAGWMSAPKSSELSDCRKRESDSRPWLYGGLRRWFQLAWTILILTDNSKNDFVG